MLVNLRVARRFMISQFYSWAETQRARRDSNPQPSDPKSDALSIELRAPKSEVYSELVARTPANICHARAVLATKESVM